MCMMCDGFSADDAIALEHATMLEYGYVVIGVTDPEPRGDAAPWAYTIGLGELDHPELIVAGVEIDAAKELLGIVAAEVLDGHEFRAGDTFGDPPSQIRIDRVHEVQYDLDTFAVWHAMHARGLLHATDLHALQVFAPASWLCECHRDAEPVLSDARARVGVRRLPNRAERRRRRRLR